MKSIKVLFNCMHILVLICLIFVSFLNAKFVMYKCIGIVSEIRKRVWFSHCRGSFPVKGGAVEDFFWASLIVVLNYQKMFKFFVFFSLINYFQNVKKKNGEKNVWVLMPYVIYVKHECHQHLFSNLYLILSLEWIDVYF